MTNHDDLKKCNSCGHQAVMLGDDCDKCGGLWVDVVENKTMKANEFVKKFGWNDARVCILNCANPEDRFLMRRGEVLSDQDFDDLKRLVESHELVEIHGLEKSKEIVENAPSDDVYYSWTLGNSGVKDKTVHVGLLRKAIADVESCL